MLPKAEAKTTAKSSFLMFPQGPRCCSPKDHDARREQRVDTWNAGAGSTRKTDVGLFIKCSPAEGIDAAAKFTRLRHVPMAALWRKLYRLPCARKGPAWQLPRKAAVPADMPRRPSVPSRPGEFHPESLTEPDLILSH